MLKTIGSDFKRAICSWSFWSALVIAFVILVRPIIRQGIFSQMHQFDYLYLMTLPMGLSGFSPFAVLFVVFPYATSYCDDYNSGYLKSILSRIGVSGYARTKLLANMLAGGACMALAFFMIFVFIMAVGIPTTPENMADIFEGSIWQPWISPGGGTIVFGAKTILAFLFGAVWSTLAMLISILMPNRYVTLIVPFVIYQALWTLMPLSIYNPLYALRGDGYPSYGFIIRMQLVILAVLFLTALTLMRRKLKND